MTRLDNLPASLQKSLQNRSLLKIIAGLSNFDESLVRKVSAAAGSGGADLLDVACDPELVRIAIEESGIPVCVSAVDPELFKPAIEAGASMIEIGNFDSFYPKGRFFKADEVLALTSQTRRILPEVFLSVTVPHILPLHEQSQLALDLISEGADVIQTEGGTSSKPVNSGVLGLVEKASPALAATYCIADSIKKFDSNIPVLCASGMSSVTLSMAIAVGASGVGVGSAVNKLTDKISMIAAVRSLKESINSTSLARTN